MDLLLLAVAGALGRAARGVRARRSDAPLGVAILREEAQGPVVFLALHDPSHGATSNVSRESANVAEGWR
jgi:hypothetical protein